MKDKPSVEDMWKAIERYGIKREMFELSNPKEETLKDLYHMIEKNREMKRDQETVKRLREYIEKIKDPDESDEDSMH